MLEPPWLVAGHRASGWTRPTGALETLRLITTVRLFSVLDQGQKSFEGQMYLLTSTRRSGSRFRSQVSNHGNAL
jgi:hypothetical protein